MPTLYIMRHGKAENTAPDINRHLSRKGQEKVKSVARLLSDNNIKINQAIYSPAARAKETALLMCQGLNITDKNQFEDARIYNASVSELQSVLSEINKQLESVLLVGHNPGLADLVLNLCEEAISLSAGDIAVVYGESWDDISHCKCKLVEKY